MKTYWTVKDIEEMIQAEIVDVWDEGRWVCINVSNPEYPWGSYRIKIRKF